MACPTPSSSRRVGSGFRRMEGSGFARHRRSSRSLQHQLPASQASFHSASTASTGVSAVRDSPHRVLGINELLEKILRDLVPSAQHAAWNVSVTWRRMMAYILRTSYRDPYPCSAVEHGQAIQANLQWLQPSQDELVHLEMVDSFSQEIPLQLNG
jgi:hypothetical protein